MRKIDYISINKVDKFNQWIKQGLNWLSWASHND